MFTGIIEDLGTVTALALDSNNDAGVLTVRSTVAASDASIGDSISINGVCLTVTRVDAELTEVSFDVMGETLARSALGATAIGDSVNIERALRADARLGGHIVQGHVDAVGTLISRVDHPKWRVLRFTVPTAVAPLLVEKGSIAVDGVSLTVSGVSEIETRAPSAPDAWFEVSLIPETLQRTVLGSLSTGSAVNIETDILARHIARLTRLVPLPGTTSATERENPWD